MREVTAADRATFLLDYIDLLLQDHERGARRLPPHGAEPAGGAATDPRPARSRERWVINKLRALCTWYTKGFDNGSHLRIAVNGAESIQAVRDVVEQFFVAAAESSTRRGQSLGRATSSTCRRRRAADGGCRVARRHRPRRHCRRPVLGDARRGDPAAPAGRRAGRRRHRRARSPGTAGAARPGADALESSTPCGASCSRPRISGPRSTRWSRVPSPASRRWPPSAVGTCCSSPPSDGGRRDDAGAEPAVAGSARLQASERVRREGLARKSRRRRSSSTPSSTTGPRTASTWPWSRRRARSWSGRGTRPTCHPARSGTASSTCRRSRRQSMRCSNSTARAAAASGDRSGGCSVAERPAGSDSSAPLTSLASCFFRRGPPLPFGPPLAREAAGSGLAAPGLARRPLRAGSRPARGRVPIPACGPRGARCRDPSTRAWGRAVARLAGRATRAWVRVRSAAILPSGLGPRSFHSGLGPRGGPAGRSRHSGLGPRALGPRSFHSGLGRAIASTRVWAAGRWPGWPIAPLGLGAACARSAILPFRLGPAILPLGLGAARWHRLADRATRAWGRAALGPRSLPLRLGRRADHFHSGLGPRGWPGWPIAPFGLGAACARPAVLPFRLGPAILPLGLGPARWPGWPVAPFGLGAARARPAVLPFRLGPARPRRPRRRIGVHRSTAPVGGRRRRRRRRRRRAIVGRRRRVLGLGPCPGRDRTICLNFCHLAFLASWYFSRGSRCSPPGRQLLPRPCASSGGTRAPSAADGVAAAQQIARLVARRPQAAALEPLHLGGGLLDLQALQRRQQLVGFGGAERRGLAVHQDRPIGVSRRHVGRRSRQ